jgi:hypothetical protein
MTNRKLDSLSRLFVTSIALGVCACQIPNQIYRPVPNDPGYAPAKSPSGVMPPSVISVAEAPKLPTPKSSSWPPHPELPCQMGNLINRPCLAFIEFDDFGEVWQRNPSGRPSQLQRTINLIKAAKEQDPRGQPLILTFVHGWKHNAKEGKTAADEDSNVVALQSVLNELHDNDYSGHVVIGIYIAWRGGNISPNWPVAQQFSLYDRGAAAHRVGNTSLTEALMEISDTAYASGYCESRDACGPKCAALPGSAGAAPSASAGSAPSGAAPSAARGSATAGAQPSTDTDQTNVGECRPLLLFVGHSFGALVLERALLQETIARMEAEYNNATALRAQHRKQASVAPPASASPGEPASQSLSSEPSSLAPSSGNSEPPIPISPIADLVIYVNSAAAALESKQLLDYLAFSGFTYRPAKIATTGGPANTDQPLFLSITSEADLATAVLFKIGFAPPLLYQKLNGSIRSNTPSNRQPPYTRACFDPTGDPSLSTHRILNDVPQSSYYWTTTPHLSANWSHVVTEAQIGPGQSPADPPYCVPGSGGNGTYSTCHIGSYIYTVNSAPGRCNGTPYWVIQVQKELIPDHDTIFTGRLIAFLKAFIPTKQTMEQNARPMLTLPAVAVQ